MIIMLGAIALFIVGVGSFKFFQIRRPSRRGPRGSRPRGGHHDRDFSGQVAGDAERHRNRGRGPGRDGERGPARDRGEHLLDSGKRVEAGDVLVKLDTRQERAQLAVAESQRDLSKLNFDRAQHLLQKGVVAQAEYDRMAAETKQAESRVGEIRAMIDRKQIRAPFSGTLGIRQINLGQYLEGGSAVVRFNPWIPCT